MGATVSLSIATMEANLSAFLMGDHAWDMAEAHGPCWYPEMWQQCLAWAEEYGHPARSIAGIVAVYSATMGWAKNKAAVIRTLDAWRDGKRGADLPAVTRNHECVRKAERILMGADPNETIVKRGRAHVQSWKTLCFWYNIIGRSTSRVTVDVWMWRILSGDLASQHRPDGREYMHAERVIRAAARQRGMRPAHFQAWLWVALTGIAE